LGGGAIDLWGEEGLKKKEKKSEFNWTKKRREHVSHCKLQIGV